jgi:hypothetical protein
MTGLLTVQSLTDEDIARSRMNRETYKLLLQACYAQVQLRAQCNVRSFIYTIPLFLPNRPGFKVHRANRYICDKLARGGFRAAPVTQNSIYIDWSHARPKPSDMRSAPVRATGSRVDAPRARLDTAPLAPVRRIRFAA